MKNENGKSNILLIIIIILIIIAVGVAIEYLKKMLTISNLQDLKTNMLIMQAETKKGLDNVCFQTANLDKENEENLNKINQIKEANLKGIKLADSSEEVKKSVEQLPSEVEIDENCYYLDDETLSRMGIDEKRIKQYEYFIAKYDFSKITVEIISTKGYNENYTLTQINQLSKDD